MSKKIVLTAKEHTGMLELKTDEGWDLESALDCRFNASNALPLELRTLSKEEFVKALISGYTSTLEDGESVDVSGLWLYYDTEVALVSNVEYDAFEKLAELAAQRLYDVGDLIYDKYKTSSYMPRELLIMNDKKFILALLNGYESKGRKGPRKFKISFLKGPAFAFCIFFLALIALIAAVSVSIYISCYASELVNITKTTDATTNETSYMIEFEPAVFDLNNQSNHYYFNSQTGALVEVNRHGEIVYPEEYQGQNINDAVGFEKVTEDIPITKRQYSNLHETFEE